MKYDNVQRSAWTHWMKYDVSCFIAKTNKIPEEKFAHVVVREPSFFEGLNKMLGDFDAPAWRNWLRWHILSGSAAYLNEALVNQNFAFYGTKLSGTPQIRERYKRAISLVEGKGVLDSAP